MLPQKDFLFVVQNTILVSIDLILKVGTDPRETGVLMGLRTNNPAKGFFFVPGGIWRKGETREEALRRISKNELGFELELKDGKFLGAYDHHYDTNAFNDDFGTQYVALGYEFDAADYPALMEWPLRIPKAQHSEYEWVNTHTLMNMPKLHQNVHENNKMYFR